jgi:hypothetical protein
MDRPPSAFKPIGPQSSQEHWNLSNSVYPIPLFYPPSKEDPLRKDFENRSYYSLSSFRFDDVRNQNLTEEKKKELNR